MDHLEELSNPVPEKIHKSVVEGVESLRYVFPTEEIFLQQRLVQEEGSLACDHDESI